MKELFYFGTNLREAGHYFYRLTGESMDSIPHKERNFPFDPERLVEAHAPKGEVQFYKIKEYWICAIAR